MAVSSGFDGETKAGKNSVVFPQDFGGDQEAGPTSVWALEGFRSLQGVGEARARSSFLLQIRRG